MLRRCFQCSILHPSSSKITNLAKNFGFHFMQRNYSFKIQFLYKLLLPRSKSFSHLLHCVYFDSLVRRLIIYEWHRIIKFLYFLKLPAFFWSKWKANGCSYHTWLWEKKNEYRWWIQFVGARVSTDLIKTQLSTMMKKIAFNDRWA